MKRYLTGLVLITVFCAAAMTETADGAKPSTQASQRPVTINRIKLNIDGQLLLWEDAAVQPVKAAGMSQDPAVLTRLLSWYGLEPGKAWDDASLADRLDLVRRILDGSRLYYAVQAYVIPPQRDPERRTLFLGLTSGFSMRFAGGGAWGMFGDDNADGAWLGFRLFAGYNLVGASVGQGLPGISPGYWGAGLFYGNNGLDAPDAASFRHDGSFSGLIGTSFWPFRAELGLDAAIHGDGAGRVYWELAASPGLGLVADWSSGDWRLAGSAWFKGNVAWLMPEHSLADRWTARLTGKAGWSGLLLAAQASAGLVPSSTVERMKFDLGADPDRGVRADWPAETMAVNHYLMFNGELRWRLVTFPLGFIAASSIEPFLFVDLAAAGGRPIDFAAPGGLTSASAWEGSLYATGGGLRILLGVPVYTDFTFGAGCAPPQVPGGDWRWKFVFSVTPGF
jgi:hypothetical protein